MANHPIALDKPGVYLFPSASQVSAQIDRECLIVFSMPLRQSCGFVMYDPSTATTRELVAQLETLHEKVSRAFEIKDDQIVVKIFGLSRSPSPTLTSIEHWLSSRSLKIAARDLGKNVGRNLSVDCGTGRISVSYAETYLPGFPQFLTRGTARQRLGSSPSDIEVLVLSRNAVCRQLTLQAVEEHKGWSASVPLNPDDIWAGKEFPYFPWSWVILYQDLEDEEGLVPWVTQIHKAYPQVQFCWVGDRLLGALETLPGLTMIPPLEPHLLGEFKRRLATLFAADNSARTRDRGVLQFPRAKKR